MSLHAQWNDDETAKLLDSLAVCSFGGSARSSFPGRLRTPIQLRSETLAVRRRVPALRPARAYTVDSFSASSASPKDENASFATLGIAHLSG
jgi:hypothetical protein